MPESGNKLLKSTIQDYTNPENKVLIMQSVLDAYEDGSRFYAKDSNAKMRILEHPLLDDHKSYLLILVQFDKKNTLAVVYQEDGEFYSVFSVLGRFYEITDVYFLEEPISKYSIIMVKERINMVLGAFESNEFLKGLLWNGSFFYQVINTPYNIYAYWNTAWEADSNKKQWQKVAQNSNLSWNITDRIILYFYEAQEYSISSDTNSITLPESNTFQIVQSRFTIETFFWSSTWRCFILYEGLYKKTGEIVAVIQDLSNSIYSLVEDIIQKCVILTPQNETLVIPRSDLKLQA